MKERDEIALEQISTDIGDVFVFLALLVQHYPYSIPRAACGILQGYLYLWNKFTIQVYNVYNVLSSKIEYHTQEIDADFLSVV